MKNIKKWKKAWTDDTSEKVKNYDKIHDIYILKRQELLSIIAKNSLFIECNSKLLLDLGCGTGAAAFSVLEKNKDAKAILIDGSKPMLKVAKINAKKNKYKIKTKCYDLSEPNWLKKCNLNKKYQLIISSLMIHHLTDVEKLRFFKDIFDILIPGGTFIYADVLKMENDKLEEQQFNKWIEEIIENKKKAKINYKSFEEEKALLKKSIESQGDMPATKNYILNCFKKIGFKDYEIVWIYIKFGIFKTLK